MNLRWIVWITLGLTITVLCLWYGLVTPSFDSYGTPRLLLGVLIGLLGLAMVFTFPQVRGRKAVIVILLVSTLTRIAIFPTGASDDVNRYLWEGNLYSQGVSPYTHTANHESYVPYRDQYWEPMNHKDNPTAYPPLSLHAFSFINSFAYSPTSYKAAFLLADLILIAVLLALLHHYHRPLHWALFYALSPISILSFAGEGHFDILMVLFLTFSVLAHAKKWFIPCGIAVGLAISIKVMAIVAAPIILLKTGAKGIIAGILICLTPFILHYEDSLQMAHGLINFGAHFRFNAPMNQLLVDGLGLTKSAGSQICILFFLISWAIGFWLCIKNKLWMSLNFCLGGLILFAPIVHFWYLSWILPFVAFRPSLPWLTLSLTTPIYFLVWNELENTGNWALPLWARCLFWLPFVLACLIHLPRHLISLFNLITKTDTIDKERGRQSWSIVIPTLTIDRNLTELIQYIELLTPCPDEVIIVSSSDSERDKPHSELFSLKTVHSSVGRGLQIKTGVEAATSDWCLILHADNRLQRDTISKLQKAIESNIDIIGGSLGQRFNRSAPGLLLIESMNDFRASLLQTSFGDQNQFFHRRTAIHNGVLTDQPLMEDVEMSDRLRLHGDTLHLAHESTVSAEKWKKTTYWKRFFTIVRFYFQYRALFYSAEKRAELSKAFYETYYPKELNNRQ